METAVRDGKKEGERPARDSHSQINEERARWRVDKPDQMSVTKCPLTSAASALRIPPKAYTAPTYCKHAFLVEHGAAAMVYGEEEEAEAEGEGEVMWTWTGRERSINQNEPRYRRTPPPMADPSVPRLPRGRPGGSGFKGNPAGQKTVIFAVTVSAPPHCFDRMYRLSRGKFVKKSDGVCKGTAVDSVEAGGSRPSTKELGCHLMVQLHHLQDGDGIVYFELSAPARTAHPTEMWSSRLLC
ncbi:unnamed protein product [Pleuronectes platessa]|uniref:Uncharacterized protein n=1 Tax=Pleuronectes platessa TaxID=8262 RepID=A0A9N7V0A2_PLEPL|nr:unnamed protein product [Pleuronectes platessa]